MESAEPVKQFGAHSIQGHWRNPILVVDHANLFDQYWQPRTVEPNRDRSSKTPTKPATVPKSHRQRAPRQQIRRHVDTLRDASENPEMVRVPKTCRRNPV